MNGFNYARAAKAAERLIARFGQAGTLRRPTDSGADYKSAPGAPTNRPCKFVVLDYEAREIDGTRILETDKQAFYSGPEPLTSDELVEFDGKAYKIKAVNQLKPATTVVYFDLQVCR